MRDSLSIADLNKLAEQFKRLDFIVAIQEAADVDVHASAYLPNDGQIYLLRVERYRPGVVLVVCQPEQETTVRALVKEARAADGKEWPSGQPITPEAAPEPIHYPNINGLSASVLGGFYKDPFSAERMKWKRENYAANYSMSWEEYQRVVWGKPKAPDS